MRPVHAVQKTHSVVFKAALWARSLVLSVALIVSGFDRTIFDKNICGSLNAPVPVISSTIAFADSGLAGRGQEKANSAIMLSMSTAASKQRLITIVGGAYAVIWAFFFLTHDKGEKSE